MKPQNHLNPATLKGLANLRAIRDQAFFEELKETLSSNSLVELIALEKKLKQKEFAKYDGYQPMLSDSQLSYIYHHCLMQNIALDLIVLLDDSRARQLKKNNFLATRITHSITNQILTHHCPPDKKENLSRLCDLLHILAEVYHQGTYEVSGQKLIPQMFTNESMLNFLRLVNQLHSNPVLTFVEDSLDVSHLANESFTKTICDIADLFNDQHRCVELLTPLENELFQNKPLRKLLTNRPNNLLGYLVYNQLAWPLVDFDEYKPAVKGQFLEQYLERYFVNINEGLLPNGKFIRFCGFVKSELANDLAAAGHLFLEQSNVLGGNQHGKYSHALQIYLICQAKEKGWIAFPQDKSIKDLLKCLITPGKNNESMWGVLLDQYAYSFRSPMFINSFLMTNDELPLLKAYLTESFLNHYVTAQNCLKPTAPALSIRILIESICAAVFPAKDYMPVDELFNKYGQHRRRLSFWDEQQKAFSAQLTHKESTVYIKKDAQATRPHDETLETIEPSLSPNTFR